jgi:hypothetical protein
VRDVFPVPPSRWMARRSAALASEANDRRAMLNGRLVGGGREDSGGWKAASCLRGCLRVG